MIFLFQSHLFESDTDDDKAEAATGSYSLCCRSDGSDQANT